MGEKLNPHNFASYDKESRLEREKISRVSESMSAAENPLPYFLQMKKDLDTDVELNPSQVFGKIVSEIEKVNAVVTKYSVGNTQEPFFTLSNTELTKRHPTSNFEMVHPEKRKALIDFFKILDFDKETVRTYYSGIFVLAEGTPSISNEERLTLRTYKAETLSIIDEVYGTE